ncbi:MAG: flavodoxin family protein [Bacteroidales bacterium]|nr:flavodoxin family protein [Bacteroidales bacterium]MBS3775292.1 flavodoxin family protein [Bacteroidales bacterium]
MNVLLFNGSPRKEGNTAYLLTRMADVFSEKNARSEFIQLGGKPVQGCTACMECRKNKDERCVIDDDEVNTYIQKMKKADAIVIGSPVYFSQMTPETKAFIDRCGYVIKGNGSFLSRKIGAAVTVARRAGMMPAFQSINNFFFINDMIVPGSRYWNVALAKEPGEVQDDEEGYKIVTRLAENILWLHNKISR